MSAADPGGKLVESGSFRIDRSRTLKKLQRYQIPGGTKGFLAWIRCAVAGGATEIRIGLNADSGAIRIQFDGKPFSREALLDPYAALFERRGTIGERNRHLGLGLLWAWRSGAGTIAVASGENRLNCASLLEEEVVRGEPVAKNRIELRPKKRWRKGSLFPDFERECALCPAKIYLHGSAVIHEPVPGWPSYRFGSRSAGGEISLPDTGGTRTGVVSLYSFGARVNDYQLSNAGFPFHGMVGDNRFRLNASLTRVVEDDNLRNALAELQRHYGRFLVHAAREHAARAPETGKLLVASSRLRAEWKRLFDFDSTNDEPPRASWVPWHAPLSKRMRVHIDARVSAWLRVVTESLSRGYSRNPSSSHERELWKTPLIYDVRGRPMNLERLMREDKTKRVRFSKILRRAHTRPDWIVWALTRRDELWLHRLAKRTTIDVTKLPERSW
jgi:hypothetical protein